MHVNRRLFGIALILALGAFGVYFGQGDRVTAAPVEHAAMTSDGCCMADGATTAAVKATSKAAAGCPATGATAAAHACCDQKSSDATKVAATTAH